MSQADEERERQREKGLSIDTINRLFGVETFEGASFLPEKPQARNYSTGNSRLDRQLDDDYKYYLSEWEKKKALHDAYVRDNTGAAEPNRLAREELYSGVRGDVYDFQKHDLDEQKVDADRGSKFSLARRGVTGGSSDLDTNADILRRYNRGVLTATSNADVAARGFQKSDEAARLELIDRINSGLSLSAAQQRASQVLADNLADSKDDAKINALGQVFSSYGAIQQAQNNRNRRGYGGDGYGSTYYGSSDGYSGRTS